MQSEIVKIVAVDEYAAEMAVSGDTASSSDALRLLARLWQQSIDLREQSLAIRSAAMEIRALSRDMRLRQEGPAC